MTGLRLFSVFLILVAASVGWVILGSSIEYRTHDQSEKGWQEVGALWGETQAQHVPVFQSGNRRLAVTGSDISADIQLDQRRKGLLWYATYAVDLDATYRVRNDGEAPAETVMTFTFPSAEGVYDGFGVAVDGAPVSVDYGDGSARARFAIPAGATATVETGYSSQGQDEWRYVPTEGVGVIDDFSLAVTTDFDAIDFPGDAVSPTSKERSGEGWLLNWEYESLVSGRAVAVSMPTPLNPGPVASRIAFFAPVSLMFYFAALVLLTATRRVKVHPMNYAFLAAGFFAFHLLFAYLVDRIDLHVAFLVAAVVSVGLCVAYLNLAVSDRRTLAEAAIAQFVFLVLFSYSFFFEGLTGLAITIGAVLTLAYFMLRTGRTDWEELFERSARERASLRTGGPVPPIPSVPAADQAR